MRGRFILFLFLLILLIFISGCLGRQKEGGNQTVPEGEDEALKFEIGSPGKEPEEEFEVYPNQIFKLQVRLLNQVNDDIRNVYFKITDPYGLHLKTLDCGEVGQPKDNYTCFYDVINRWTEKKIDIIFKTPSEEEIAIERNLKPEFTLTYDFSGETSFYIPILDEKEKSTEAKMMLKQTKGPIHLNIERSGEGEEWEMEGNVFAILVKFEDVFNPKSQITIDKKSFELKLKNNLKANISDFGPCDFEISNNGTVLRLKENITLPMQVPLLCTLKAGEVETGWEYGIVEASYEYTYKVVKTLLVKVKTKVA